MDGRTKECKVIGHLTDIGNVKSLSCFHTGRSVCVPRIPAIYFVFEKDELVYIGSTSNLQTRWRGHQVRRIISDESVVAVHYYASFDLPKPELIKAELINHFCPIYNLQHSVDPSYAFRNLDNESIKKLMGVFSLDNDFFAKFFTSSPGWIKRAINGTNKKFRRKVIQHLYLRVIKTRDQNFSFCQIPLNTKTGQSIKVPVPTHLLDKYLKEQVKEVA